MPFQYSDISPAMWQLELSRYLQENKKLFLEPVWSHHEKIAGVVDFSKDPRNRIEKVLSLAEAEKCDVHVHLSPSWDLTQLPRWLSDSPLGVIPMGFIYPSAPLARELDVPSLKNSSLDTYVNYLKEMVETFSFYFSPEGPVKSCTYDFGFLSHDYLVFEDEAEIERAMASRYGEVKNFNALYAVSYASWQALTKPSTWRLLFEKRPFLASYDFQCIQNFRFEEAAKKISIKRREIPFRDEETLFVTESVAVQWHPLAKKVLPFWNPEAYIEFQRVAMQVLPFFEKVEVPKNRKIKFLSSKYISKKAATWLFEAAQNNCEISCVGEAPHWDENLHPLTGDLKHVGSILEKSGVV